MIFTRNLITTLIPEFVNISDAKLTQAVNALGMEIESVTKYQIPDNTVIGKLLTFEPIEGTHLNLCDVQIGENTTTKIVCGASGLQADKKVIVALPGAKLANGVEIAKRVIKGVESNGMMCAYAELTGSDAYVPDNEKDQIVMFDDGVIGSKDWPKIIGLDDTIYDITVPANRNDENSYVVFCYEIANKLGLRYDLDLKNYIKQMPSNTNEISADLKICSFLCFLDYELNYKHNGSSTWETKAVLMNHGIKPINWLMDKLAVVTLMTNCPTHTYDADKLNGIMSCKLAGSETKFVALNGKTYTLNPNDIVIQDQNQPVSIACVIGSENTKWTPQTKKVRIEVGNFSYANVRNTNLRLNADTTASKRASRPLSNYLNLIAVELIKKMFGYAKKTLLFFQPNWNDEAISLDYDKLAWFINEPIEKSFVLDSLKRLGYEPNWLNKHKFNCGKWRLDVSNEEDMFEDILKIIDINRLKPISIEDKLLPIANNTEYNLKQSIKDVLINNYFSEVKTYNLTNQSNLNKFNIFDIKDPIKIQCNNANREYFRLSLIDNMLKVYQYNDARKLDLFPIFEIQKLFNNTGKRTNLTCLSFDKYSIDSVSSSIIQTNLNYYKGIINQIANVLNVQITFAIATLPDFYNNECLSIVANGKVIGYMGKIRNSLLKQYDLENRQIYCLTMNVEELIKNYKAPEFQVKPFGIYQRISKDINIVLNDTTAAQVNQKVEQIKQVPNVVDAQIISIFNKEDKIIYTVRYYLDDNKQFNSTDIENIAKEIEKLSSL